jgi:hypothetical protein
MEALWEDLSQERDRIQVPMWHQEVLKETERKSSPLSKYPILRL